VLRYTGGSAVAAGKRLFTTDACSDCHSLDGSAGAGSTVAGLAGSKVELDDGTTVTADDAYLAKSIADPDGEILKGYEKGVMPGAIASFGLDGKPQDVAALVTFIKSQP
jgi:cytochrome c oxidase subunit 2